ncbi:hypothetical protein [Demequina iriomotensis]|uniref:hypothetical protein n=1 Tax=Demequina iriomotensis TaxID=1536641 RepID=UPI0007854E49|nr:hypothetical protein [Demequina iriomotensis]
MGTYVEWDALGNILLWGLVVGAGLPALFALGVRIAEGPGARDANGRISTGRKILSGICFGIAALTVLGAVAYIAAGGH